MNKLEDYAYVAVSEGHKKFNWRKRYISLKEGTLLVYNDKKETLKQKVPLIGVTKIEERNKERIIAIFSTELQKPFILKPIVETQLDEWAALIESEFHSPVVTASRRNTITSNANGGREKYKLKNGASELSSGKDCTKTSTHSPSSSSSSILLTKGAVNTTPRRHNLQSKQAQQTKQEQREKQKAISPPSTSSGLSKTLGDYLAPLSKFEQCYHSESETYIGGEHAGTVSMIIRKDGKRAAIRRIPTVYQAQTIPYTKHNNITKVFDTFETPKGLIICEEYMDQGTLRDVFAAQDVLQLTEEHLSYLLYESISAVAALHSLGVVHGRITSDTFLLNAKGKVKLSLLSAENQWKDKEMNCEQKISSTTNNLDTNKERESHSFIDSNAESSFPAKVDNQEILSDEFSSEELYERDIIYSAPEYILCTPPNPLSDVWSLGAVAAESCGITKTDLFSVVLNGLSPLPRKFIFSTLCRRCFTETTIRPNASSLLRDSVFDVKSNCTDFVQYCNERIKEFQEKQ